MPNVSVIIPAYNSGPAILETVRSVLGQTYENLEVIVIDDGSTDQTLTYLNTIRDPRLKVFSYDNGGLAAARNRGIAQAEGEYIAFLDHDDLWTPDKLEDQILALQQTPDAGVVYSWTAYLHELEDGSLRYVPGEPRYFEGNVYPQLLLSNFIDSGSNILARRQAIESVGLFDAAPVSNEDWDFYLRLAAQWSFAVVPKYQILYRQTSSSMSSQVQKLEQGGLVLIEKTYAKTPSELQYLKRRSLSNHYRYCSELYLNRTNLGRWDRDAWRSLKTAIYVWPQTIFHLRTQAMLIKFLLTALLPPKMIQQLRKLKQQRWDVVSPADVSK